MDHKMKHQGNKGRHTISQKPKTLLPFVPLLLSISPFFLKKLPCSSSLISFIKRTKNQTMAPLFSSTSWSPKKPTFFTCFFPLFIAKESSEGSHPWGRDISKFWLVWQGRIIRKKIVPGLEVYCLASVWTRKWKDVEMVQVWSALRKLVRRGDVQVGLHGWLSDAGISLTWCSRKMRKALRLVGVGWLGRVRRHDVLKLCMQSLRTSDVRVATGPCRAWSRAIRSWSSNRNGVGLLHGEASRCKGLGRDRLETSLVIWAVRGPL